jgi:hypothetical protein
MILLWAAISFFMIIAIMDGIYYGCLTPSQTYQPGPITKLHTRLAALLHGIAYILAVLRLPFSLIPYSAKLCTFLILRGSFKDIWQKIPVQILRLIGDFTNLIITAGLLHFFIAASSPGWVNSLVNITIAAEYIRLLLEKGQMLMSAMWQYLPHNLIARRLKQGRLSQRFHRYVDYYDLDDHARLIYILRLLENWAADEPLTASKLCYVQAFRQVEDAIDLRSGQVRNVALGEIFVHRRWSNDPWLLIGQALRRSAWLFDPRYLSRPFFYRTQANPLATRFVLERAGYSLPFALYQLGHEIKAARFEIFYRCCQAFGVYFEVPVQADGTYQFDVIFAWLDARLGRTPVSINRPLWNDTEVIQALLSAPKNANLSAKDIALTYTYPLIYVEKVLEPAICQAVTSSEATRSGTSQ